MSEAGPQLEPSWKARVGDWFAREDMRALSAFLRQRKAAGVRIYPPGPRIFAAFDATPFDAVKVVVLGQDPYHGHGQAHGLCFAVPPGVPVPPSLRNMYKELERDLGIAPPDHGWLMPWARQGVLLLNAVLTVREGEPGSHAGKGWEEFTDAAITALNAKQERVVFVLWGAYARKKARLVTNPAHVVLESAHPSPLSAKKFFGTRPFSAVNKALADAGLPEIDWNLAAE